MYDLKYRLSLKFCTSWEVIGMDTAWRKHGEVIDMLKGTRRGRAKKNWVYCVSEEIAKKKKNWTK